MVEAIEHLRHDGISASDAETGPSELSEEFMTRFETYAEGASTEDLRQRWGRILAREVKKPGTFSLKALRVIDELELQPRSYLSDSAALASQTTCRHV
jgi:Protein of unknown function (DUF2806)